MLIPAAGVLLVSFVAGALSPEAGAVSLVLGLAATYFRGMLGIPAALVSAVLAAFVSLPVLMLAIVIVVLLGSAMKDGVGGQNVSGW